MWYIWKARNDARFQRRTWSPIQVHQAATTHINTYKAVNNESVQSTQTQWQTPQTTEETGMISSMLQDQTTNRATATLMGDQARGNPFVIQMPATLQGSRCYSDAAITPDQISTAPRRAGLGVFIINMLVHPPQTIFIKAEITRCTSVLMAEAAALALGAAITKCLQLQHINFLSDNLPLVSFFNARDRSNPPDWRIKHFTQHFINCNKNTNMSIFKIQREQNQTAHSLARQALGLLNSNPLGDNFVCSNTRHISQCVLFNALQTVLVPSVNILSALCC